MKKLLIFLGIVSALFAGPHVASAACTPVTSSYPGSLDTFVANDCIPSAWANTLETTIGTTTATTSLQQRVAALSSSLATTTITASGTTLNGSSFTFASTTIIAPYASGTSLYWAFINPGYITGNQTITLSGAVSGSGATTITTAYNTSTMFGYFSAAGTGLTYNSSTGAFTWTNPGYITTSSISINGTAGNVFTGLSTSTGISAGSCTSCNVTFNGNGEATTYSNGSGGGGSVTTSSAITANEFPYWANTTGGLSGTSTLYYSTSTGNISIGTSTALNGLNVDNPSPSTETSTFITVGNAGSQIQMGFLATGTTQNGLITTVGNSGWVFKYNSSNEQGNGNTAFRIYTTGDLGFGNIASTQDFAPFAFYSVPVAKTTSSMALFGENLLSGGNASGTYIGLNAASGYTGDLIDLQTNSSTVFKISSAGNTQTATINEPIATSSATTSSTAINWANSNKQWVLLAVPTTTISLTNPLNGASYTLWLIQDASGTRMVSWTTTGTGRVEWMNGNTAPTLSTAANAMDEVSFQCFVPSSTSTLSCYGTYGPGNFTQ